MENPKPILPPLITSNLITPELKHLKMNERNIHKVMKNAVYHHVSSDDIKRFLSYYHIPSDSLVKTATKTTLPKAPTTIIGCLSKFANKVLSMFKHIK